MPGAAEELGLGLVTGVILGFLLQKGRASRHDVVVGQFLLREWTFAKILVTSIAVGAVGVWALATLGVTAMTPEPAQLVGLLVGAVLFGVGMIVLGYCPATAIAAAGEGKRDGRVGVAGMAFGAFLFVVTYDLVVPLQRDLANLGPVTWPGVTHSSPWPWIAGVGAVVLAVWAVTRIRLRRALAARSGR